MAPNSAPDTAELLEALATELSPEAVVPSDPDRDAVDGVRPGLCAQVDSPDAVAAALAICQRLEAVVVPRGGGSHLGLGQPPERVDLLLDLSELNAIIEYRPADLTLAVAAGTRLADVQALLAGEGQMLALDPASEPNSTVGGLWPPTCPARVGRDRERHGTW